MKRASSPTTTARVRVQPKRARVHTPPRTSLHSWLKPGEPAPLLVSSPALNAVTSTFVSFSLALSVPPHVRTAEALKAHVKRVVRELDVVSLVGRELVDSKEGAFQNDGGLALGNRRRAREPDHRMWACRALALKEGRDGTAGEDDFQLLEAIEDDGEKYGGDRVLKVLKEIGAVDVVTVCARWFGGDMLGPARFHHIGVTAQDSAVELGERVKLRDLRGALRTLDEAIADLRAQLAPPREQGDDKEDAAPPSSTPKAAYDDIADAARLQRLLNAKEKTIANLEARLAARDGQEQEQGQGQEQSAGAA